ncbi:hypothetical protein WMY93_013050 [Mugilogobius chulae]|uniref:Uncharacterized protein n=1 Tax=Mugilogobius chulae TaxID=88201 RepID=A0AAW0P502_9GOBI
MVGGRGEAEFPWRLHREREREREEEGKRSGIYKPQETKMEQRFFWRAVLLLLQIFTTVKITLNKHQASIDSELGAVWDLCRLQDDQLPGMPVVGDTCVVIQHG